jgi:predicted membrane-bound spermidine synthase
MFPAEPGSHTEREGTPVDSQGARAQDYTGLFLITLATLMYEILLTRIFSVTMWYCFAFVAISVAMFGMTVGALVVYLLPGVFTRERTTYHLALNSVFFSISVVIGFLVHLRVRCVFDASLRGMAMMTATYLSAAVPFFFSGIAVCLALTRFPRRISRLYAADLAGAALGCVILKYSLDIMDGPSAVMLVAALAGAGGLAFSGKRGFKKTSTAAIAVTVVFCSLAVVNSGLLLGNEPFLRIKWFKGSQAARPAYEKWNSFSYVTVKERGYLPPFGWGMSETYPAYAKPVNQNLIRIDAEAVTPMIRYTGKGSEIYFLKYDMVNMAHFLRSNANVMVVGVGGGRDVLSALAFGQLSVTGVEINGNIIDLLVNRYGEFSGHLDRDPRVRLVNDEARSYITRQDEEYDIIQVSMIDTWAATAAGAFVLTENSLYTIEAWRTFLDKLSPDGILTFTRWYSKGNPYEVYRLVSLASAALREAGVSDPRGHIMIVKNISGAFGTGIGTVLLSPGAFTEADIDHVEKIAGMMRYEIVLTPRQAPEEYFAALASEKHADEFIRGFPLDISPPTDNRPFFFNMLRLGDIFNKSLLEQGGMSQNIRAVSVLWMLMFIVAVLTALFILLPLILSSGRRAIGGSMPMFFFFAAIGFGFILVETSQLQRLTVFLGHPSYSLSVVLFSLLLSSGMGSFSTRNIVGESLARHGRIRLLALVAVVIVFGSITPMVIMMFRSSETMVRILVSVGILFPLGYFMGMAFPIGMRLAAGRSGDITPWFWGINGATSVCGSVFSVFLAIHFGISTSFWVGFACYLVALAAFSWTALWRGAPEAVPS